ncbi:MAG: acetyltransferase [Verrucomicrobiota bacterium]|jgi:sugar O-acyltransferase (sialic acid O-acetyltransferase NeuD family)
MKKLLIVGAGGFGREMYAWAGQHPDCGRAWALAGFLDDNPQALAPFGDFAPVAPLAGHRPSPEHIYVCALGMPDLKEKLVAPLVAAGAEFLTFIHPAALLGARVKLGRGVVVCPGAILSADIAIGDFAMINLNCTIGHDATLGAWTSLSAQCDITGHVRVADRVFMGSRASVIPSKSVGSRSIVGAGAVVVTDVPAGVTVVGIPARIL